MTDDRSRSGGMSLFEVLERSREREKGQTLFYRSLAAAAEREGRSEEAERLNALHADEQHHLSRLTARLLELGEIPADLTRVGRPSVDLAGWEAEARRREEEEVVWYREALEAGGLDATTRATLREILESEHHHRDELGGKWMPASPGGGEP